MWLYEGTEDYDERFTRILPEMNEEAVCQVMGGPPGNCPPDPIYLAHNSALAQNALCDNKGVPSKSDRASVWFAQNRVVVARFDSAGKLVKKQLHVVHGPGVLDFFEGIVTGRSIRLTSILQSEVSK